MPESISSVFHRLVLMLTILRRLLTDSRFADRVVELHKGGRTAAPGARCRKAPRLREVEPNAGLQLLGLLQKEGRFIDFLEEDIGSYTDAEAGAAARILYEGCKQTLAQHFTIEAVRTEAEGAQVTLAAGFDASAVRLMGHVVGQAPFTGRLVHRGWRVTETRLPQVASGHDVTILAPAEVEL